MRHLLLASASALVFATTAHSAFAAQAAPAETAAVEEVVVTAQRRSEKLQDIPISVQAVTASGLEKAGVTNSADLVQLVPGLNMSRSSTVWQVFMRGVGTQTIQPGSDPSISVYMDGVYLSAPGSLMFSFNNIERVEVLKGPQGTLFGRNATGGLIQVITSDPTSATVAKASVGYGNYNAINTSAYVAGGNDQVAASLSVIYNNQDKGWGRNIFVAPPGTPQPNTQAGIEREVGLHGKLVWTPNDRTKIKVSGMYLDTRGDQNAYRYPASYSGVRILPTQTPYFRPSTMGFYDENTDIAWTAHSRQYLFSSEASYESDLATFKSISSYLDATLHFVVPSDSSPLTGPVNSIGVGGQGNLGMGWKTVTQEVQILSNGRSGPAWLQWIGGAFFLHSDGTFNPATGSDLTTILNVRNTGQETTSYAVYAQGTIDLGSRTKLTLGLRESKDDISAYSYFVGYDPTALITSSSFANVLGNVTNVVPKGTAATSFSKLTWHASLDYHLTDDVMLYVANSRGYKSGAYNYTNLCFAPTAGTGIPRSGLCVGNPNTPSFNGGPSSGALQPPVKPEILDSYEAGIKSEWFEHRLRLNADLFYYDYSNLQIAGTVFFPPNPVPVSVISNAASARIKGVDIDGEASITPNFSVNGSLELLDAKYKDFPGAIYFFPNANGIGDFSTSTNNAAGNQMVRAPKVSASVGFNWSIPTSAGQFELSSNVAYTGKFYWDQQQRLFSPAHTLVNGQVSWSPNETWKVRVWGRNLGGVKYYGTVTPGSFGDDLTPAAPRTFGVAVDWKM